MQELYWIELLLIENTFRNTMTMWLPVPRIKVKPNQKEVSTYSTKTTGNDYKKRKKKTTTE